MKILMKSIRIRFILSAVFSLLILLFTLPQTVRAETKLLTQQTGCGTMPAIRVIPAHLTTVNPGIQTISWNSIPNPAWYQIIIIDKSNNTTLVNQIFNTPTTSFSYNFLLGKTYNLQVLAQNTCGYQNLGFSDVNVVLTTIKTYTVTAHPVCANGRSPVGNFRIEWKKWSNLSDNYTPFKSGDSTTTVSLSSADSNGFDAAYIGLEYQGSGGTNLQPTGTPPNSNISYAQWFVNREWAAKFLFESVPAGSYTVNYLAPAASCSEETACTAAGGTWQNFPNSCADKCSAGGSCADVVTPGCNCANGCWDSQNSRCNTTVKCTPPSTMQYTCGYNGDVNKVQLSWRSDSSKLMFRIDKNPSSWFNPSYKGDYLFGPFPDSIQPVNIVPSPAGSNYYGITKLSNSSIVVDIDTNSTYGWGLQDYDKASIGGNFECRTDISFSCPAAPLKCECGSGDTCSSACTFNKNGTMRYSNTIKCSLSSDLFSSAVSQDHKNAWCNRQLRTKGDASGDGVVNLLDYFYHISALSGGKIPRTVNVDYDGNGILNSVDIEYMATGGIDIGF